MDELIKALNLIKETCKNQEQCEKCPLSRSEECLIVSSDPSGWDIQIEPIQKVLI
jgi:hypothetical protein